MTQSSPPRAIDSGKYGKVFQKVDFPAKSSWMDHPSQAIYMHDHLITSNGWTVVTAVTAMVKEYNSAKKQEKFQDQHRISNIQYMQNTFHELEMCKLY